MFTLDIDTKRPELPILLVEDAEHVLNAYRHQLGKNGINNYLAFKTGEEALNYLKTNSASLVLLDLKLPGISGEKTLSHLTEDHPEIPVLIVTISEDTNSIVNCMKNGAFDYLVKPVGTTRLITAVKRALEFYSLKQENAKISESFFTEDLHIPEAFSHIVTHDLEMKKIFKYIEAVAPSNQPVFITGDTGTGKEMIARSVHNASGRKGKYVAVTVAGLEDNVFSDTLFGHERGAFTGADKKRAGLIEQATNGTLFLDEIGDLSLTCQVKLLRLIQEKEYYTLGSDTPRRTNARIVLATNKDIAFLKESPDFRNDLYYRIATHHVHIPPLKERQHDIRLLFTSFFNAANKEINKPEFDISNDFFEYLENYDFPGNVRELKGMAYDAASMCDSSESLTSYFDQKLRLSGITISRDQEVQLIDHPFRNLAELPTLEASEAMLIEEAMRRCNGNRTAAATILGTNRQRLHRKLKKES